MTGCAATACRRCCAARQDRYRKIAAGPEAMDRLLADLLMEAHAAPPAEIWLDADAADDPVHGNQELRFYHGCCREYCCLPLYIFCGERLLRARLRPADSDAAAGTVGELKRIIGQIRHEWPHTRIVARADSGLCRDEILSWCEASGVYCLTGLARSSRLEPHPAKAMRKSRRRCVSAGAASRRFVQFRCRTRDSWPRARQVMAKAEALPDPRSRAPGAVKDNVRFAETNLPRSMTASIQSICEQQYCARGESENRIKEQQLNLFADRTSCHAMRASQLRLHCSSFACALLQAFRRLALAGTAHARAQCGTIRVRFLKVAAAVRITARRVWLPLPDAYPWQRAFGLAAARLRSPPP